MLWLAIPRPAKPAIATRRCATTTDMPIVINGNTMVIGFP
ncbi:Uncharacterised protein [Mycobacterium tuberculosis]|nr:Uncharacterised protein [Mycobacterium tuberculosis]